MLEAPQASDLAERLSDNERDRREAESERLVALAKENGLYIPETDYGKFGIRNADRTGESVVYKNDAENRHYKVKDPYAKAPIKGNAPEDAIYEHLVHNRLFPEDPYRFEGIGNNYLGDVRIILSQPSVLSAGQPTKAQIDAALAARGLYPEDKYTYGNEWVSVTDVEGDNVLADKDGLLHFIDPIIKFKRPARQILEQYDGPESVPEAQSSSESKPAPVSEESKRIIDKVNRKNATRKDVICKDNTSPLSLLFYHDHRKKSVGFGMSVSREYRNTETQKITDNCPDKDAVQFQTTTNNRFKGS